MTPEGREGLAGVKSCPPDVLLAVEADVDELWDGMRVVLAPVFEALPSLEKNFRLAMEAMLCRAWFRGWVLRGRGAEKDFEAFASDVLARLSGGVASMKKARYEVVESESIATRLTIRDVGPWDIYPTITNDAEGVVADLVARGLLKRGRRLFYYDSEGQLDEVLHDGVRFLGFKPGPRR